MEIIITEKDIVNAAARTLNHVSSMMAHRHEDPARLLRLSGPASDGIMTALVNLPVPIGIKDPASASRAMIEMGQRIAEYWMTDDEDAADEVLMDAYLYAVDMSAYLTDNEPDKEAMRTFIISKLIGGNADPTTTYTWDAMKEDPRAIAHFDWACDPERPEYEERFAFTIAYKMMLLNLGTATLPKEWAEEAVEDDVPEAAMMAAFREATLASMMIRTQESYVDLWSMIVTSNENKVER